MAAAALPSPRADLMPPPPPPPPVPPTTERRPRRRAREVSSRYLSTPVPATPRLSTASSTRSLSPTPSPRGRQRVATPFANENHPPPPPPPAVTVARRRAVQKLFEETGACNPRASVGSNTSGTVAATPRPLPRSASGPAAPTARRGYPRLPTPARAGSYPSAASAAADADAASCCSSSDTASTATDFSEAEGGLGVAPAAPCESPPLLGPASCRGGRLSSELRSSVPESGGSARASNPLCYRSLNSALSISTATTGKLTTAARPPQPQGAKIAELKKAAIVGGRKVAGKQEDVHQLRLLDNRYLQHRFLNARAEAATKAKAAAAEKSLYGLAEKLMGLRESVAEKRAEVDTMRREQRLFSVVNVQVPYLDQWTDIVGEHSSCLRGITTALHNASLRLPVTGNVKASCEEITDVLTSAAQLLEPLSPCVGNFLPKVEEIDGVAKNFAQVFATERTLIEECGNLLYQAHNLQIIILKPFLLLMKPLARV
ncbi:protein ENDOSPERM DEFECTIVE 1-like [Panicum miliaceum]|uniref:Protein ENDOSPERM DEFECTIVE 1-like n=1 Tax=Panicum miliaceum TaxID=4540 RepID=A0A3L6T714_PANMI|nr:protein ENDOSPERM DEFECTIVE 1-like [Panicum miliaceum]